MDKRKYVKVCPDLTQVIWGEGHTVDDSDFQRIQLKECLKCAAYHKGRCCKYNNNRRTIDVD